MRDFDPETHREPTDRERFNRDYTYQRGDRVGLLGTDVNGTVLDPGFMHNSVYVEWDTPTDNGLEEWIGKEHIMLVAVCFDTEGV